MTRLREAARGQEEPSPKSEYDAATLRPVAEQAMAEVLQHLGDGDAWQEALQEAANMSAGERGLSP
jgi:hypothetical protein